MNTQAILNLPADIFTAVNETEDELKKRILLSPAKGHNMQQIFFTGYW